MQQMQQQIRQQPGRERMLHYDLLRLLAAFSVVMLHTSAQFWDIIPVANIRWLIANTYNSLSRFGVPIFVMISGALFLEPSRELNLKRLYTHNILRLGILYLVWSSFYGLLDCFEWGYANLSPGIILQEMLYGRYHLWYLPMLIGIYMLLPILKLWVANADRKNIEYFLLLFLILQLGRETILALPVSSEITYAATLLSPDMVCSYIGYFILGYYISRYGIEKKYRGYIYLAAIPSAACNVFLSCRLSLWKGEPFTEIDNSFGVFTFITVVAIFLFVTEKAGQHSFSAGTQRVIHELSLNTLGVYLMHVALLEQLQKIGIHSLLLPNVVGIPLLAIFCYAVCSLAAALLRRIPGVGRYLC